LPSDPTPVLDLFSGNATARILPKEGGVASALTLAGLSVLARTPWADRVRPHAHPAPDEPAWVERWRGGWQLCFPTAGQPEPGARPAQSFHGTASQARWEVREHRDDLAALTWADSDGLAAERVWRLTGDSLTASTTVVNRGAAVRTVIVAEHLVLGGDLLGPVGAGGHLRIEAPQGAGLAPLDYAGFPAGPARHWPGPADEHWELVDDATPARVACLVDPRPRRVRVVGGRVAVTVRWDGLPHALLWEELAQSTEAPWNGEVVALGIEPTSTPHGGGTAATGAVELRPGDTMQWTASLEAAIRSDKEDAG
jgi:hypothetical protein